jgi:hypothetical protein
MRQILTQGEGTLESVAAMDMKRGLVKQHRLNNRGKL